MPESEEKPELPPKFKLQIDKSLLSKADVQAAQNAGASDIKAVQGLNKNIHSGSAGGDQMESLQLVAFDDDGHQRIVAERPKQTEQTNPSGWSTAKSAGEPIEDAPKDQVFEYPAQKINDHTLSAGLDYEAALDGRNIFEKITAFANAAEMRAADPENWTRYVQAELDKMTGVWEGLNLAKEEVKSSAVAGWNALKDGTVAKFLAQPNAINDPLFKLTQDTLSAMAHDPDAVNQKLEVLGSLVGQASEHYSSLSDKDKGREIGKTMFTMVNPELPNEAMEPLEAVSIENATQLTSNPETYARRLNTEPHAGSTTIKLADKTEKSCDDGFEGQAGTRGDWSVLNERPSPDVVQQMHRNACVAAVGEMLTNGSIKQEELLEAFKRYHHPEMLAKMKHPTADLVWLGQELGSDWDLVCPTPAAARGKLNDFLIGGRTWAAEFREFGKIAHIVAVDGINDFGEIMIRDPAEATRYELTMESFMELWSGRSLQKVR
jgi:hypothetical protein